MSSGGVSGGHLNPAVSVAVASVGKFPWWKVSCKTQIIQKLNIIEVINLHPIEQLLHSVEQLGKKGRLQKSDFYYFWV